MALDTEANLKAYLDRRTPTGRFASFDYCFNHFQSHREKGTLYELATGPQLQLSCLHLGFYLASWGMLRGSSVLLRRSARRFVPAIEAVVTSPPAMWELDANNYTDVTWDLLADTAERVRVALPDNPSDILVTKTLLGVFGCVPAFDTYFKKGFGVSTFGKKGLKRVGEFYANNAAVIDRHCVPTLDFDTGTNTSRKYTRAKVIDMIFFIQGG